MTLTNKQSNQKSTTIGITAKHIARTNTLHVIEIKKGIERFLAQYGKTWQYYRWKVAKISRPQNSSSLFDYLEV